MLHTGTDKEAEHHQRMIDGRHAFIAAYCRERGWPVPGEANFQELSIDQIAVVKDPVFALALRSVSRRSGVV